MHLLDDVEWVPLPKPTCIDDNLPHATHSGVLELGNAKLRCYQLSDGQRLLSAEDVDSFFKGVTACQT